MWKQLWYYLIIVSFRSERSSRTFPAPRTTVDKGSSLIDMGSPVSSLSKSSRFLSSDPPPVNTIPVSIISAASSGGVCSRAMRIVNMKGDVGAESVRGRFRMILIPTDKVGQYTIYARCAPMSPSPKYRSI